DEGAPVQPIRLEDALFGGRTEAFVHAEATETVELRYRGCGVALPTVNKFDKYPLKAESSGSPGMAEDAKACLHGQLFEREGVRLEKALGQFCQRDDLTSTEIVDSYEAWLQRLTTLDQGQVVRANWGELHDARVQAPIWRCCLASGRSKVVYRCSPGEYEPPGGSSLGQWTDEVPAGCRMVQFTREAPSSTVEKPDRSLYSVLKCKGIRVTRDFRARGRAAGNSAHGGSVRLPQAQFRRDKASCTIRTLEMDKTFQRAVYTRGACGSVGIGSLGVGCGMGVCGMGVCCGMGATAREGALRLGRCACGWGGSPVAGEGRLRLDGAWRHAPAARGAPSADIDTGIDHLWCNSDTLLGNPKHCKLARRGRCASKASAATHHLQPEVAGVVCRPRKRARRLKEYCKRDARECARCSPQHPLLHDVQPSDFRAAPAFYYRGHHSGIAAEGYVRLSMTGIARSLYNYTGCSHEKTNCWRIACIARQNICLSDRNSGVASGANLADRQAGLGAAPATGPWLVPEWRRMGTGRMWRRLQCVAINNHALPELQWQRLVHADGQCCLQSAFAPRAACQAWNGRLTMTQPSALRRVEIVLYWQFLRLTTSTTTTTPTTTTQQQPRQQHTTPTTLGIRQNHSNTTNSNNNHSNNKTSPQNHAPQQPTPTNNHAKTTNHHHNNASNKTTTQQQPHQQANHSNKRTPQQHANNEPSQQHHSKTTTPTTTTPTTTTPTIRRQQTLTTNNEANVIWASRSFPTHLRRHSSTEAIFGEVDLFCNASKVWHRSDHRFCRTTVAEPGQRSAQQHRLWPLVRKRLRQQESQRGVLLRPTQFPLCLGGVRSSACSARLMLPGSGDAEVQDEQATSRNTMTWRPQRHVVADAGKASKAECVRKDRQGTAMTQTNNNSHRDGILQARFRKLGREFRITHGAESCAFNNQRCYDPKRARLARRRFWNATPHVEHVFESGDTQTRENALQVGLVEFPAAAEWNTCTLEVECARRENSKLSSVLTHMKQTYEGHRQGLFQVGNAEENRPARNGCIRAHWRSLSPGESSPARRVSSGCPGSRPSASSLSKPSARVSDGRRELVLTNNEASCGACVRRSRPELEQQKSRRRNMGAADAVPQTEAVDQPTARLASFVVD
uniref:SCP domain-containing protein n=1 Tax=Macrostomum lignano TaxID=282301 RepID=A0A1I8FPV8_9PLAT